MDSIPEDPTQATEAVARFWLLEGRVQGVGFRPFVYRLAHRLGIVGWVRNCVGRVEIWGEGDLDQIERFSIALIQEAPPVARPRLAQTEPQVPQHFPCFDILPSTDNTRPEIHVPPDAFTCQDCLSELNDPQDRRYHYPFINCTQCGPRYTIIENLPYDRPNTTMAGFPLCQDCRNEYQNPLDRRFHAQPLACPACGPELSLHQGSKIITGNQSALQACLAALRQGAIVAVKGIGGYHLMCDPTAPATVQRLRQHKPRPHKPLALMVPARGPDGLQHARKLVELEPSEAHLLCDPMRPIVLARRQADAPVSEEIAPGLNEIGIMLPYSPLHHLLLEGFGGPLVATSGNVSGEPVLTDNQEAQKRLQHVADVFLHHNRPIQRPADDSVFRTLAGRPRPLRLGRGYAPLELDLPWPLEHSVLAVGGHMKNTVALAWNGRAVLSPHIGDLGTPRSMAVFAQVIEDLQELYQVRAEHVLCDAHPGYSSSRWAKNCGLLVHPIFHHYAHASALAGEYSIEKVCLVFTWDGVGYGPDGTLWGGEVLLGIPGSWQRVARMRPFHLPGGEKAGREPWRSAAALAWETGLPWRPRQDPEGVLFHAWEHRLNSPQSTAAGRIFDAAAAWLGVCEHASFEGQGPMWLEALASDAAGPHLPVAQNHQGLWEVDWSPLLAYLSDSHLPITVRVGGFHESLALAAYDIARVIRERHAIDRIGLTGGVFQNKRLASRLADLLQDAGFQVFFPQQVPCNDAAISFGQIVEYSRAYSPSAINSVHIATRPVSAVGGKKRE